MINVAKTKGSGAVECVYSNTTTKSFQPKIYYMHAMEDDLIACGVYK